MAVEHGGRRQAAARQFGLSPSAIIDFSANINPLGPPPGLGAYLARCLTEVAYYPDPEYGELKTALKRWLQTTAAVVLGNGAAELIYLLPQALRPRRVLVVEPAFGEYAAAARAAGAQVERLILAPEKGFALAAADLAASLRQVEMCFLGHPNNPTGDFLLDRETLVTLADRYPGCLFVVDESFLEFVPGARPDLSVVPFVGRYANLCVLYSLTKFYALPGLRLGCAVVAPVLAAKLEECSPPWRINVLAARAGIFVLQQSGYAAYTRSLVGREREFLCRGLEELGFMPFPAKANFLLVSLKAVRLSGTTVQRALGPKGILVRRCASFPGLGDHYLRLAVRLPWENRYLLRLLASFVGEPEGGDERNDAADSHSAWGDGLELPRTVPGS